MRLALAIAVVVLTSTTALADGGEALERARRSYDELRYDEASMLLSEALEDETLTSSQREQALLLKGVVEIVRGKEEGARIYFRELLTTSPEARLPEGLSPKITAVFDEVRASLPPRAPPPVTSAQPASVESGTQPKAASGAAPSSAAVAANAAEEIDDAAGLSAVAVGVAAGVAVAAVVLVAGASALLFAARGQPPESSLGTLQLP